MKNKNTTYLEKMGFKDSDLTSPKHDELCVWFSQNYEKLLKPFIKEDKKTNYISIIKTITLHSEIVQSETFEEAIQKIKKQLKEEIEELKQETYSEDEIERKTEELKWLINKQFSIAQTCKECNLKNTSVTILQSYKEIEFQVICNESHLKTEIKWEQPIKSGNYFIGFVDFKVIIEREREFFQGFFIEVKPKVTSLGETFRQLNTYKSCLHSFTPVLLVKEIDVKNKLIFESQGIIVIEYKENLK